MMTHLSQEENIAHGWRTHQALSVRAVESRVYVNFLLLVIFCFKIGVNSCILLTEFYFYYLQKLDLIRETQIGEFEASIQPRIEEEKPEEKKRIKRRRGGEDEAQYKKPRKPNSQECKKMEEEL